MAGAHHHRAQSGAPGGQLRDLLPDQLGEVVLARRPPGVLLVHRVVGAGQDVAVVGEDAGGGDVDEAVQGVRLLPAGAGHLQGGLHIVLEVGPHQVGRVHHGVHPLHRPAHEGGIGEVPLQGLQLQPGQALQGRVFGPRRHPHLVAPLQELPHQAGADLSAAPRDQHLHRLAPPVTNTGTGTGPTFIARLTPPGGSRPPRRYGRRPARPGAGRTRGPRGGSPAPPARRRPSRPGPACWLRPTPRR